MKPLLFFIALTAPAATGVFDEVGQLSKDLAEMTGLTLRRAVPAAVMSRDQLAKYLDKRVTDEVNPEEIRAEEITLRALGFVDDQFDLKKSVLGVLQEQAAAFYDTKKRRLYMMESSTGQTEILLHELSHALADQHFNLERFIKHAGKSDDSHMARMAVMEGQATWLMTEWRSKQMGVSLIGHAGMVDIAARQMANAGSGSGALDTAPLYLQETLLFPYSKGLVFQHAVLEKLGKAGFKEVFANPPTTTQQIIHPELYFNHTGAQAVTLPLTKAPKGFRGLMEGNLGELDHQILLRQFKVEDWEKIAAGWTGGEYRVYENRKRKRTILAYCSRWRDDEAALTFFRVYRNAILPVKTKDFAITKETATSVEARSANGPIRLRLEGNVVSSVEGGIE